MEVEQKMHRIFWDRTPGCVKTQRQKSWGRGWKLRDPESLSAGTQSGLPRSGEDALPGGIAVGIAPQTASALA